MTLTDESRYTPSLFSKEDSGSNYQWDINDNALPMASRLDEYEDWPNSHCRFVYSDQVEEARRHTSGWAMRNTNNHNVNILKKSCLGVLVCNLGCVFDNGDIVHLRPAICDKARRKQVGKPCTNPKCSGHLELLHCRGHCGYPVTHFWRHLHGAVYFQGKGIHDHPKPENKTSAEARRHLHSSRTGKVMTTYPTQKKRGRPSHNVIEQQAVKFSRIQARESTCSCPPFECVCSKREPTMIYSLDPSPIAPSAHNRNHFPIPVSYLGRKQEEYSQTSNCMRMSVHRSGNGKSLGGSCASISLSQYQPNAMIPNVYPPYQKKPEMAACIPDIISPTFDCHDTFDFSYFSPAASVDQTKLDSCRLRKLQRERCVSNLSVTSQSSGMHMQLSPTKYDSISYNYQDCLESANYSNASSNEAMHYRTAAQNLTGHFRSPERSSDKNYSRLFESGQGRRGSLTDLASAMFPQDFCNFLSTSPEFAKKFESKTEKTFIQKEYSKHIPDSESTSFSDDDEKVTAKGRSNRPTPCDSPADAPQLTELKPIGSNKPEAEMTKLPRDSHSPMGLEHYIDNSVTASDYDSCLSDKDIFLGHPGIFSPTKPSRIDPQNTFPSNLDTPDSAFPFFHSDFFQYPTSPIKQPFCNHSINITLTYN